MTSPLTLSAVPASIPIARVWELITSLGIDVDQLTTDGITIGWNSVQTTVYATDPGGARYVDALTRAVAVHKISIPVIREVGTDKDRHE